MQYAVKAENRWQGIENMVAKPVLKWAGGKSQLLPVIQQHYPQALLEGEIDCYIEPFVGGGAVFFDIASRFDVKRALLLDINPELIILYNSLKQDVERVIAELSMLESRYLDASEVSRKEIFLDERERYNTEAGVAHEAAQHEPFNAARAAATIFLNRTCFNGLFRVNQKGCFNVPHGSYKKPRILFAEKLRIASFALKNAEIKLADFAECERYISGKTFVYYDPPYRPVSKTSHFTAYSKDVFDDNEQGRLAAVFRTLHMRDVLQLLSNSDPTNYVDDPFFDDLYAEFTITRLEAKRMINSNAAKRGPLREILIKNY